LALADVDENSLATRAHFATVLVQIMTAPNTMPFVMLHRRSFEQSECRQLLPWTRHIESWCAVDKFYDGARCTAYNQRIDKGRLHLARNNRQWRSRNFRWQWLTEIASFKQT